MPRDPAAVAGAAVLIELLYFDGCPNHEQFLPHLNGLLQSAGVSDPVRLVRVADDLDAQRLRFPGSPTLRLDGQDVDPVGAEHDVGLQCRLYLTRQGLRGAPDDDVVLAAVSAARR